MEGTDSRPERDDGNGRDLLRLEIDMLEPDGRCRGVDEDVLRDGRCVR